MYCISEYTNNGLVHFHFILYIGARKSTGTNEMVMVVDQQQQQQQTTPVAMNRLLLREEMTSNYKSTTLNKMPKSFAYKVRDTASEIEAMAKQATNKSKRKAAAAVDSTTTNGDAANNNNNKKAKKVKKSPNAGGETAKREAPVLVWVGEPEEPLDNNNYGGGGWPKGWIKRHYQRKGGSTKGLKDRYWYSPLTQKKFRSMVEVKKFMLCLKECHGDEDEAWNMFKKGWGESNSKVNSK
jgi:hypothetical protein